MFLDKQKKVRDLGVSNTLSPMKKAMLKRKEQQRALLDRWDMFANVMTTRNQLEPAHPNHISLDQMAHATVAEVRHATQLPSPDNVSVQKIRPHAKTKGGWWRRKGVMSNKATSIIFGKSYLKTAVETVRTQEDTDPFRKVIRTASHEMKHVEQRKDKSFMETTTSDQREIQTYSSEIFSHPSLPALRGKQLSSTIKKLQKRLTKVGDTSLDKRIETVKKIGKGTGV